MQPSLWVLRRMGAGLFLLCLGLMGCNYTEEELPPDDVALQAQAPSNPMGKGGGTMLSPPTHGPGGFGATIGNGIAYNGGPIMTTNTKLYYIWYGNWSGNTAPTILTDLANNLGGSPYFNINTTYDDNSNRRVANSVTYGGSTTNAYSRGTALTDADINTIVTQAINAKAFPLDPNALYVVLTSADVNATSGFCTSYCGWHTYATINGANIKYAFVGNAERCPTACSGQQNISPNGNLGADAMASVLAHELSETVTDPNINAWYNATSGGGKEENADKCAWTFGSRYTASNGSMANVHLGSRDYLLQQNWVNAGGGSCVLSYISPPSVTISGPGSEALHQSSTYTANVTAGATPFQYAWSMQFHSPGSGWGSWSTPYQGSQTTTASINSCGLDGFQLKVTVTDAQGRSAAGFETVWLTNPC